MARSKIPKNLPLKQVKEARNRENPSDIMCLHPSWGFGRIDTDGDWPFTEKEAGGVFWEMLLPRLSGLERMTWGEVLIRAKKENHSVPVEQLNPRARHRLTELKLEMDELISLRINGTHRLYGFLSASTFVILWLDKNHGDNDGCVCRSRLKHT